ncbi:MAG: L-histidine N(alpha)-methyltransferase [Sphingomonadales bacterium]
MNDLPATVRFYDFRPTAQSFGDAVAEGLRKDQKSIPSRFFYDDRGSELFERICELDEYYVTRTELSLLRETSAKITRHMGRNRDVVEFGCGSSAKVRAVLDAADQPSSYCAIDISKSALLTLARELADAYRALEIIAVCADYTAQLSLPGTNGGSLKSSEGQAKVGFFPGSTIGNFTHKDAEQFLQTAASMLGPGGSLIIGVDLKKDIRTLEAAYDDAKGVTAQFNLNLLARINRELGGKIELSSFRHKAFFDPVEGRVEMHLESLVDQHIALEGMEVRLAAGETIHTEDSYKYTIDEFKALASRCGFEPVAAWTDDDALFSIHYLTVAAG